MAIPLQYSCLEKGQRCLTGYSPWVVFGNDYIIGHAKSWTWLSWTLTHTHAHAGSRMSQARILTLANQSCLSPTEEWLLLWMQGYSNGPSQAWVFKTVFTYASALLCKESETERVVHFQKLQGNCTRGRESFFQARQMQRRKGDAHLSKYT